MEGEPSTEFPLQTVSVPSNVNSYSWITLDGVWSSYVKAFTPLEANGVCQGTSVGRTVSVGSTEVMLDD